MSRFVSAGTAEDASKGESDEWARARQEVENSRREKEEASQQKESRTLYEVLQENKAKKQEAFEESIKLKHQFRSLDDDEVDFLDSVLEETRAKENSVKRETAEQLNLFRRQQEEASRAAREAESLGVEEEAEVWAGGGKKRKKAKSKEPLKGLKLRKTSSSEQHPTARASSAEHSVEGKEGSPEQAVVAPGNMSTAARGVSTAPVKPERSSPAPAKNIAMSLGLGNYSSDEKED